MDILLSRYGQEPSTYRPKPTKHIVKSELIKGIENSQDECQNKLYANKVVVITARVLSNNSAEFNDNYFYKYLCSQYNAIKELASFAKKTFNNNGFFFSNKYNISYLDNAGLPCDVQKLIGRICKFKIKVIPYKRDDIAGLQIRVFEIRL